MKHKKQKKTKKAGRILLAVFAVVIGTLGVLLFTSERWMRKTWPNLSMEELVYQLKAPIAGTSHDLLMSYICSSALIAAAALILLILVSIFLREKRKAHVAFGMICIAAGAASIVYSINDVWAALDVKDYLKRQVSSSVRWQQTIERLIADGAEEFVEIGPGRSLSGFMRKINRDVTTCNIDKMEDFNKYVNR